MPGIVERMELRKVSTVADDDSLDEHLTGPTDCEKGNMGSQFMDSDEDGESNSQFMENDEDGESNSQNTDEDDGKCCCCLTQKNQFMEDDEDGESNSQNTDDEDDGKCCCCLTQKNRGKRHMFLSNGIPKKEDEEKKKKKKKKNYHNNKLYNNTRGLWGATKKKQFINDNEDGESDRFLANGMQKKKKLKKEYDEEYHPGHTSFGMSVFNLSNAIMGSGILGLSFAMANTGIVLFTLLLIAVAILSLYSVHLLLMTAKEGGSLIYEKLGERAFGWPGKMAAFGSIIMQNIGAMSSYLFIVKYELPEVIRAFMGLEENSGEWYLNGNYLVVFVSIGVILPLSLLKNLGYLGYTSGFSLSCMVFFLVVVIYKKTQLPCPLPFFYGHSYNLSMNGSDIPGSYALQNRSVPMDFSRADVSSASLGSHDGHHSTGLHFEPHPDDEEMCTPKYFVCNSQTAYTIPILAFAFVCHPEVLPIYSELKDRSRKKMQNVSNLSILAMLVMYMLSALFGYLTFYNNVEAELLHTFTKVYKFDTLLLLVRLAVLTAVTLTVPIVLFPIRSSITTLLFSKREFSWTRHLLIAAFILAFNNMLVIFVPTIRDIFGFIGASAATLLIFILPAAFYLRLVKSLPFRSPQKIGAAVFLVVGIIFMIGSLTLIVLDWIHNPPGSGGHH